MGINPVQLIKLKERFHLFKEDHPKMVPFMKALHEKALEEGTILEFKAITKDGQELVSNIRLTANDVETIQMYVK